jgi:hypothetical protein
MGLGIIAKRERRSKKLRTVERLEEGGSFPGNSKGGQDQSCDSSEESKLKTISLLTCH